MNLKATLFGIFQIMEIGRLVLLKNESDK